MPAPKVLKQVSGALTEEQTVATSAGAGSADKIPALNASGVLDLTITNGKNTSAGAGDAGKLAALNAAGILDDTIINASATSSANKVVKMDGTGRIALGVLPTGVGPDTKDIVTSEALAAGDFVNIHNVGGARARKADAATNKPAVGFVLAAFGSGATATVYFEGTNNQVSGKTPGAAQFLSATPGTSTETAPSTATHIVQNLGVAVSATEINFEPQQPITLA